MLAKLLALKFGELPGAVRERLAKGSADELDLWAERVLTAESLDEVLG